MLEILRGVFKPVACDADVVSLAIDADLTDFEDAVQYFSALASGAEAIVTRNTNHFPSDKLLVATPSAFLATHAID